MVDINVNKDQGLISAIKTKLNAEQIDTSKCNASIWSQVLEQVTIENEQNKKEGKNLIYHKGNDMNGDGHSNFVIFQGVIKFSQKLWDNICRIVKGEPLQNNPQAEIPKSSQSVVEPTTDPATSGVDKIEKNNFINDLNEVQQVEPTPELKANIEKAQKVLTEQLKNFTEQDLQILGITPEKRDRLLKYLENIIYDNTHDTMQGKGIWIVVSNRLNGHEDLESMLTMLMHEANHCDENFIVKYPEYADNTNARYVEGRETNSDIMLVNTKAEEMACETLGLLTTALLYKKGVIKNDYKRYGAPVSQYIDNNGKPTQALKNDVENWVSGYTNYPEDMQGNITMEHANVGMIQGLIEKYLKSFDVPITSPDYAEAKKIQELFEKYKDSGQIQKLIQECKNDGRLKSYDSSTKFKIQVGDILVVENNDGSCKQVTLGNNGTILSPVDSTPIFQLVNAEFGGRIIFDEMQPSEAEYMVLEYLSNESQKPKSENHQTVSVMRNGKKIYSGRLYY